MIDSEIETDSQYSEELFINSQYSKRDKNRLRELRRRAEEKMEKHRLDLELNYLEIDFKDKLDDAGLL